MLQPANREKIIISADDFGKSELANKNILKLAELGKLDRVSIMPNGKFSEDELKKIFAADVKLDVHLDVEERLEDKEKIKESFIKRSFIFWSNYLFGALKKNRIENKWDSQIKKFIAIVGRKPDGINTHRYDHFFPSYFAKALRLAKKYKILRIRFGCIIPVEKNKLTSAILGYFYRKNKEAFYKSGLLTFNYCVSLDWVKDMQGFIKNRPKGEIELVCHPEREEEKNLISKYF